MISAQTGRGIETYWPGFALVLAPFQLLGIPWICNATLAGLAIFLIHRITLEVTGDRRAAGWAMLFALASSAFWANAISYYSMQAHLTANLLYAWLLLKPTGGRSFAAGLVGALALLLHNPVPHMLFAAPWLIAFALDDSTRRRLIPLALGYAPAIAVGRRLGLVAKRHRASRAERGDGRDAEERLHAARCRHPQYEGSCRRQDVGVGFTVSFLFRVPRVHACARQPACQASDALRGLHVPRVSFRPLRSGTRLGLSLLPFGVGVVPILAACALTGRSDAGRGLVTFAGAVAVLSLLMLVPFQLMQIDGFITRHLAMVPAAKRPGGNVYFIDFRSGYYIADMIQMDPTLRSEDLYLATRGGELDEQLIQRNWPNAVRCGSAPLVVQWCLGNAPGLRSSPGDSFHLKKRKRGRYSSPRG